MSPLAARAKGEQNRWKMVGKSEVMLMHKATAIITPEWGIKICQTKIIAQTSGSKHSD